MSCDSGSAIYLKRYLLLSVCKKEKKENGYYAARQCVMGTVFPQNIELVSGYLKVYVIAGLKAYFIPRRLFALSVYFIDISYLKVCLGLLLAILPREGVHFPCMKTNLNTYTRKI